MSDYLTRLKTKKQATGVLPKLPKDKKTEKVPYYSTAKTAKSSFGSKDSTPVGHFSEKKILQNEPLILDLSSIHPTHRSEYADLWDRAWALSKWIDNPNSDAPWQERAARVPELMQMTDRLKEIEAMPTPDRKTHPDGVWHKWVNPNENR